ncbi:MAG: hypothetical protein HY060_11795 [Proteobacteria bacterium]|nr:hypothetical protein [Pseudomonadota bacterium]
MLVETIGRGLAMRGLVRDWRAWSRGERLGAITILAVSLFGTSVLLAMNLH